MLNKDYHDNTTYILNVGILSSIKLATYWTFKTLNIQNVEVGYLLDIRNIGHLKFDVGEIRAHCLLP